MRRLLLLLFCLLGVETAHAHDPFDASIRLLAREADLEATVVLGWDAARQALANAGLSPEQVADLTRSRGPHATVELPLKVCVEFLEISREGKPLQVIGAKLLNEGMEITFTFLYKRPEPGQWTVQAVLYEKISEMRPGSFVATNENAEPLGASLLTVTNNSARMVLPKMARP